MKRPADVDALANLVVLRDAVRALQESARENAAAEAVTDAELDTLRLHFEFLVREGFIDLPRREDGQAVLPIGTQSVHIQEDGTVTCLHVLRPGMYRTGRAAFFATLLGGSVTGVVGLCLAEIVPLAIGSLIAASGFAACAWLRRSRFWSTRVVRRAPWTPGMLGVSAEAMACRLANEIASGLDAMERAATKAAESVSGLARPTYRAVLDRVAATQLPAVDLAAIASSS